MNALGVKEVIAEPRAGAEIGACIREAILLAVTEDRIVRFIHNGKPLVVNPEEIISKYWHQWDEYKS